MVFAISRYADGADLLHYKWMVLLMLLFSLVAFIVPLHPAFKSDSDGNPSPKSALFSMNSKHENEKPSPFSNLEVKCWCPAEFTGNYVDYATAYCKSSFISAASGEDPSAIYTPLDVDSNIPVANPSDQSNHFFKPRDDDDSQKDKRKSNDNIMIRNKTVTIENNLKVVNDHVKKLVTFQTPLMFLVFAIVLVIPHFIWLMIHDCFGVFNVEVTLETVKSIEMKCLYERSQAGNYALSQMLRPTTKSQSILYLMKKLLSVLVAAGLLFFTTEHVIPKVEELRTHHTTMIKHLNNLQQNKDRSELPVIEVANNSSKHYNRFVFLCDIKIRFMQDIKVFTLQCLADDHPYSYKQKQQQKQQQTESFEDPNNQGRSSRVGGYFNSDESILAFESYLLHVAITLIAVLLVSNALNTMGWMYRLVSSGHMRSLGLTPNASYDTVLMANFMRSYGVASSLILDQSIQESLQLKE